jgi:pyridoxal phosphate enzyme (YggS family)
LSDNSARLAEFRASISEVCKSGQRDIDEVCVVAVSKRHSIVAIQEAYAAGQRDFGESYPQEMMEKAVQLKQTCPGIRWHFVGRVQRNKASDIARSVLVHGIGSLAHLKAIERRAPTGERPAVLLQVNHSGESQKNGFNIDTLWEDMPRILECKGVEVKGLMTIPPLGTTEETRRYFLRLRELRDSLNTEISVGP